MVFLKNTFFLKKRLGFSGMLICGVLSFGLSLASIRSSTRAIMDNYHAPTKVKIEVASQLSHSGLRYGMYLLQDQNRLWDFFVPFASDPEVTLSCSETLALPDNLVATKTIQELPTPQANQEIAIRGIIAPYNCNQPLSQTNYRLTLEVVGGVDCVEGEEKSDACVTRSMVQTAYQGSTYQPMVTAVIPPKVVCPKGVFTAEPEVMPLIEAACAAEGIRLVSVPADYPLPAEIPLYNDNNLPVSTESNVPAPAGPGSGGTSAGNSNVGM